MDKSNGNIKQATLEKIQPTVGSSFTIKEFTESLPNATPRWHFHPELELVLVEHGSGKRHIGNHISYYNDGELILMGPNLPHYGFTDRLTSNNKEIVLQFREDFLGERFFQLEEMKKLNMLLKRSRQGLSYYGETKARAATLLNEMLFDDHFGKLIKLLSLLQILAQSEEYELLNAGGVTLEVVTQDNDRINRIFDYVRDHFQQEVSLDKIANVANMTVPAFCRYFKKNTNQTFTQFVNQFRVVHACKLLAERNVTIMEICFECGFNNISHFNKHFKLITSKSPSEYRKELKKLID